MFSKIVFSLIVIIIFIFGGCASNVEDISPTSIRVLYGWGIGRPYILFDLTYDNNLEVKLISRGARDPRGILLYGTFDATIVDDFMQSVPELYRAFSDTHELNLTLVRDIVKRADIEVSQYQLDKIFDLLETIVKNGPDREFRRAPVHGLPYIWAIIDGNLYWSLGYGDINNVPRSLRRYVNRDLLLLFSEISILSPQIWQAYMYE